MDRSEKRSININRTNKELKNPNFQKIKKNSRISIQETVQTFNQNQL